MNDLSVWADAVRQNTREAFMRQFTHPFLLVKSDDHIDPRMSTGPVSMPTTPIAAAIGSDDWSGNQTQISRILPKTGSFAVLRHNAVSYRVFAVVSKTPPAPLKLDDRGELLEEPAPTIVSLGRAADNDIVLTPPSVSKHHAKISLGRGKKQSELFLIDLGSRNGTSIKGRKLQPQTSAPIDFGDAIVLGDLAVSLIGAGALWEIIRAQG